MPHIDDNKAPKDGEVFNLIKPHLVDKAAFCDLGWVLYDSDLGFW